MHRKLRKLQTRVRRQHRIYQRTWRRIRRHPVAIPVVAFVVLCIISFAGFLLLNGGKPKFKPITSYITIISYNHHKITVPTKEKTVGALLNKLHINLNPGDVVEPAASARITQDYFHVNVYRAVPVEIINGGQTTFAFSAAATPRAIVQQAGIKVYAADYVYTKQITNFVDQQSIAEQVIIDPATPVNLNIYGTPTATRTRATTVAQLLKQDHIKLGQGDSVQPAADTPITPNMQVFLLHQGTKIETVQQTIPAPTQIVTDASLTFGTSAIRQQGSPGMEVLTYQDNVQNGVVVGRTLIQTVITQPPVPEIVAHGQAVQIPADKTAVMAEAGIPAGDYAYVNYIVSNESGWCPTKLQGQVGYCPGYAPASIPSYLGYGLGQATPGSKMSGFGGDWETNPVTQLRWATSYAAKYGGWAGAYSFWQSHHYW